MSSSEAPPLDARSHSEDVLEQSEPVRETLPADEKRLSIPKLDFELFSETVPVLPSLSSAPTGPRRKDSTVYPDSVDVTRAPSPPVLPSASSPTYPASSSFPSSSRSRQTSLSDPTIIRAPGPPSASLRQKRSNTSQLNGNNSRSPTATAPLNSTAPRDSRSGSHSHATRSNTSSGRGTSSGTTLRNANVDLDPLAPPRPLRSPTGGDGGGSSSGTPSSISGSGGRSGAGSRDKGQYVYGHPMKKKKKCRSGEHKFQKKFGPRGIICSVIFFPLGLLCLVTDRYDRCKICGYIKH